LVVVVLSFVYPLVGCAPESPFTLSPIVGDLEDVLELDIGIDDMDAEESAPDDAGESLSAQGLTTEFFAPVEGRKVCGRGFRLDLVPWVDALVQQLPRQDSGGYVAPSPAETAAFGGAVEALMQGRCRAAASAAARVRYQVVTLLDAGRSDDLLYGLLPGPDNVDGRGYFLVRARHSLERLMVLEAPHPVFDRRTGTLATQLFRRAGAMALALAGTHRCANTTAASSGGETKVCNHGVWGPFRESDMAHAEGSFFQRFHEVATAVDPHVVALQLHGFGSRGVLPLFTVSDGTRRNMPDNDYLPNLLATELELRSWAAGLVRTGNGCNRVGDTNLLCGTRNAQSHFSNRHGIEAGDPNRSAQPGPQFVHLELSEQLRTAGRADGYQLVVESVLAVFPPQLNRQLSATSRGLAGPGRSAR